MQQVVNCVLNINRNIDNKKEISIIRGKGYYKNDDGKITVFFCSDDVRYKYIYKEGCLTVYCNDSRYTFRENIKEIGELKNGDYIFKITTLATKIEIDNNSIILNYSLYQDRLIGSYESILSFN